MNKKKRSSYIQSYRKVAEKKLWANGADLAPVLGLRLEKSKNENCSKSGARSAPFGRIRPIWQNHPIFKNILYLYKNT